VPQESRSRQVHEVAPGVEEATSEDEALLAVVHHEAEVHLVVAEVLLEVEVVVSPVASPVEEALREAVASAEVEGEDRVSAQTCGVVSFSMVLALEGYPSQNLSGLGLAGSDRRGV